jgi:hypothetical protein
MALVAIADGRSALESQRLAIDALRYADEPLADEEAELGHKPPEA